MPRVATASVDAAAMPPVVLAERLSSASRLNPGGGSAATPQQQPVKQDARQSPERPFGIEPLPDALSCAQSNCGEERSAPAVEPKATRKTAWSATT